MFNKSKKESVSALGRVIDQPMKDFKKYLKEEHVNVGTMNSIILYLNSAYADLRQRKDTLMKSFENPEISKKEKRDIEKAVRSIYAELIKIEEKVVYLQEKVEKLVAESGEIDTIKDQ